MMAGDEPVRSYAGSGTDLLNGHLHAEEISESVMRKICLR